MKKIVNRLRSLDDGSKTSTKHRLIMAVVVAVAVASGMSASQLMEAAGWLSGIESVLSSHEGGAG